MTHPDAASPIKFHTVNSIGSMPLLESRSGSRDSGPDVTDKATKKLYPPSEPSITNSARSSSVQESQNLCRYPVQSTKPDLQQVLPEPFFVLPSVQKQSLHCHPG